MQVEVAAEAAWSSRWIQLGKKMERPAQAKVLVELLD